MAIKFDKALGLHAHALHLRAERTRLLAANLQRALANDEGGGLALGTTRAEPLYRVPNHRSQDGNTVELGVEQAAFSQNASDFQTSLTFLNMKLRGLRQAIEG